MFWKYMHDLGGWQKQVFQRNLGVDTSREMLKPFPSEEVDQQPAIDSEEPHEEEDFMSEAERVKKEN